MIEKPPLFGAGALLIAAASLFPLQTIDPAHAQDAVLSGAFVAGPDSWVAYALWETLDDVAQMQCVINLGPLYESVGESEHPVRLLSLSNLITASDRVARHGGSLSEVDAAESKVFTFPRRVSVQIPDAAAPDGWRHEPRRYVLDVRTKNGMPWGNVVDRDQIVVTMYREEVPFEK